MSQGTDCLTPKYQFLSMMYRIWEQQNLMRMVNYAGDVEIFVNKNIIDAKVRMIDREPVLAFVQKGI